MRIVVYICYQTTTYTSYERYSIWASVFIFELTLFKNMFAQLSTMWLDPITSVSTLLSVVISKY